MKVFAVMLMGAKAEPFLPACLESLYGAVDQVALNDNSGLDQHVNLSVVKQSRLFKEGKIQLIPSPFLGFGPCRDLCIRKIRESATTEDWIIFVDCDEVHIPQLSLITRNILPSLPKHIGIVDGYFYQFFQFPRFITSLDHRHNLMFRFNPAVSWEGQVHERVVNLVGDRLVLPYRYFHYGFLKSHRDITAKWSLYGSLGDPVSGSQTKNPEQEICKNAKDAVGFFGTHPEAAVALLKIAEDENSEDYLLFAQAVGKQRCVSIRSHLIYWKLAVKMKWLQWKCLRQARNDGPGFALLAESVKRL